MGRVILLYTQFSSVLDLLQNQKLHNNSCEENLHNLPAKMIRYAGWGNIQYTLLLVKSLLICLFISNTKAFHYQYLVKRIFLYLTVNFTENI